MKKQKMRKSRPRPPRPDRRRQIRGSFSWIDHRLLREAFDQGLTRLEKQLERALPTQPADCESLLASRALLLSLHTGQEASPQQTPLRNCLTTVADPDRRLAS
jgi:hypothetical protein